MLFVFRAVTLFLSTPSVRRATDSGRLIPFFVDISIHALREEGDDTITAISRVWKISIHALREEGDGSEIDRLHKALKFLSTPSVRRATT